MSRYSLSYETHWIKSLFHSGCLVLVVFSNLPVCTQPQSSAWLLLDSERIDREREVSARDKKGLKVEISFHFSPLSSHFHLPWCFAFSPSPSFPPFFPHFPQILPTVSFIPAWIHPLSPLSSSISLSDRSLSPPLAPPLSGMIIASLLSPRHAGNEKWIPCPMSFSTVCMGVCTCVCTSVFMHYREWVGERD